MSTYVAITGHREDGGETGGNRWEDTDDVPEALARAWDALRRTYETTREPLPATFSITVATEASPHRTRSDGSRPGLPLPAPEVHQQ